MNHEYFDLALTGTTLKDLFACDPNQKTVVIDSSGNYGTTYSSLSNLETSPYIMNYKLLKDRRQNNEKVMIESIPLVLGAKDRIIQLFGENAFGEQLGFVDICDIYYISDVQTRIPTSKNDIANLSLSNSDLFFLYKGIKERNLNIIEENFKNKHHPLYKALIIKRIFSEKEFMKYCLNFGDAPFVYPLYGLSELSESASMKNSFQGTVYVLNKDMHYSIKENECYKHTFTCDLGIVSAKEFKPRILDSKLQNIKVILTQKRKFTGNFLAYLDSSNDFMINITKTSNDNEKGLIKIIGIYSDAEVCPEGHQLLYFIRENEEIDNSILKAFSIFDEDIILEVNYTSKYEISP